MDELELLKKDWKKEDTKRYPKLSYHDIYSMILKKSSSIVKWIFIISILEFIFWLAISFVTKNYQSDVQMTIFESSTIFKALMIASYIVLAYFFYLFYRNYTKISTTDNAKKLMENILKTRKTVKQYVIFNIVTVIIGTLFGISYVFKHDENVVNQIQQASANGEIFKFYAGLIFGALIILLIAIALLLLFYYLIYGLLLKRLNRNYKELKQLEI